LINQDPLNIYKTPNLESPSLILGWSQDVGQLGPTVIDYLNRKLGTEEIGAIEPVGFYSLSGVRIEDGMVQFPESKFYSSEKNDLLILKSNPPRYEHYKFLNTVLDFAERYGAVKEVYTVGGLVSLKADTAPQRITTVVNQPELKEIPERLGLQTDLDYETPPRGRPTLSSFLLWLAGRRNIAGVNLWTEVSFYLAAMEDLKAIRYTLWFLDKRFTLNMDFSELNLAIKKQSARMKQLKEQNPEIRKLVEMLEQGIMLNSEESEKLTEEVTEFLEKGD